MSRLIGDMYESTAQPISSLFDLVCAQQHHPSEAVIHNAIWYNQDGERLGRGDLDGNDFRRIASDLENDEMFIILPPMPGSSVRGLEDVIKYAKYVILPDAIHYVHTFVENPGEVIDNPRIGRFTAITRERLLDLVTAPTPAS